MKDHLSELFEHIPVRRTHEQKESLFKYVKEEAEEAGLEAKVEILENKHKNIVIGNVKDAEVVFTAHYDTPACSLVPNLMMPRNPLPGMTYQLGIPLILAFAALGIAYCISLLIGCGYTVWMLMYLFIYFGLFFGVMRRGDNRNNKNDNTSGVAAVLSIMSQNPKNAAYILFDNEEKGLLGSKAFFKANKELFSSKLVINLDCVGNGRNIVTIAKEGAERHPLYDTLKQSFTDGDGYKVLFFSQKGSMSNTDYKNFPCGISVMACKQSKKGILYTPYIHTVRDTEADNANIAFISSRLSDFALKAGETI